MEGITPADYRLMWRELDERLGDVGKEYLDTLIAKAHAGNQTAKAGLSQLWRGVKRGGVEGADMVAGSLAMIVSGVTQSALVSPFDAASHMAAKYLAPGVAGMFEDATGRPMYTKEDVLPYVEGSINAAMGAGGAAVALKSPTFAGPVEQVVQGLAGVGTTYTKGMNAVARMAADVQARQLSYTSPGPIEAQAGVVRLGDGLSPEQAIEASRGAPDTPLLEPPPARPQLESPPSGMVEEQGGRILRKGESRKVDPRYEVRLTKQERQVLIDSGLGEMREVTDINGNKSQVLDIPDRGAWEDAAEAVQKYRREHHPRNGWQEYRVGKVVQDAEGNWSVVPSSSGAGFDYHRDLKTGKVITGPARHKRVAQIGGELAKEVWSFFQRTDHNSMELKEAYHWYRNVRNRLRDEYGSGADIFGDLIAAFSPNTKLKINFRFAENAFRRFYRGDFNVELDKLDRWIASGNDPSAFPREWVIKQESGKKYGQNGLHAMMAMLDRFREVKAGTAPKMRRFNASLVGTGTEPTVDLWAARTVQRIAGKLFGGHKRVIPELNTVEGVWLGNGPGARPRILVQGMPEQLPREGTQTGTWAQWSGKQTEGVPLRIGGAYGFGSDVFTDATRKLNELGLDMNADDLQAMMWIREKNMWESRGWTPIDKDPMLDTMFKPMDRYRAGISPQTTKRATQVELELQQRTVLQGADGTPNGLQQEPGVVFASSPVTAGKYGNVELALEAQVVAERGWNPMTFVRNVIEGGEQFDQEIVFVSRVIPADEVAMNRNARPGVEIYFDPRNARHAMPAIRKALKGQDGYTITTKGPGGGPARSNAPPPNRAKPNTPSGVYIQFVPEISMKFDPKMLEQYKKNPGIIHEWVRQQADQMYDIVDELAEISGISSARFTWYDTRVFGKSASGGFDDGGLLRGNAPTPTSPVGATGPGKGPFSTGDYNSELARAVERIQGRHPVPQHQGDLHLGTGQSPLGTDTPAFAPTAIGIGLGAGAAIDDERRRRVEGLHALN